MIVAAAAAAGGWYFGSVPVQAEHSSGTRRIPLQAAARKMSGRTAAAWQMQLPAVRAVPGATSEIAWIKWAFAIPDADIPAAIARLNTKSDLHALRCLYSRWVKLDPQKAWASFRKSGIPVRVTHFYLSEREDGGFPYSSMQTDPRSLIAARMLASWKSVDPAAAKAFAAKLAVSGSQEAKEMPVTSYEMKSIMGDSTEAAGAKQTPAALADAAAQTLTLTQPEARRTKLTSAVREWLEKDTAAACHWIQQLPPEDRKLLGFDYLRWSMRDAPAATRAETLTVMLQDRTLSAEDFARVVGARVYYEFSGDRQGVYNAAEAVREWAAQDPAAARKFVESMPDNDLKAVLAGEAAGTLVRTDVNAAVALLNQTGGDQVLALKGLMRGWMQSDVHAGLAWAGKIEDTAVRDACRETAATAIAASDPALALETARTITDAAIRQRIHAAVRNSLSWNPAALEQMQSRFPGDDWKEARPR